MNGAPFQYMPNPYNQINPYNQANHYNQQNQTPHLEEEINYLKREVEKLNKRIYALENKDKKDYLQKDDGLYMM